MTDTANSNPMLPLLGYKVVDLTSNIAAPFAGAVLADLGAEVVHVESRSGDDSRRMSPRIGNESAYWHVVNRNKSVLSLDIREPQDKAALEDLISNSDIFLSNLRPGKLLKNGLDYQNLSIKFPSLIHATLSAYGAFGDESDRAGYDAVLQARSGIAEITGTSDGPPVRAGVSILDIGAGTWLALGVIAALLERTKTGRGTEIATSLFETGANWTAYHVAANQVTGAPSTRNGSGHPAFSPYGIFATATEQVCIGIGGDSLFRALCEAIDRKDLLEDQKFSTNPMRVANDKELREILEKEFLSYSASDLVSALDSHGVACDIVQKPEDLLRDSQAIANAVMLEQSVEGFGVLKFPGLPLTFFGHRPQIRH